MNGNILGALTFQYATNREMMQGRAKGMVEEEGKAN